VWRREEEGRVDQVLSILSQFDLRSSVSTNRNFRLRSAHDFKLHSSDLNGAFSRMEWN
jgi:hypothetical protein